LLARQQEEEDELVLKHIIYLGEKGVLDSPNENNESKAETADSA
jgi:hypothetical protein